MQTGRPFHKFKMLKMKKVGRDQGMKLTMLWCSPHRNPVDFSQCRAAHVRFGSKADIELAAADVRYSPKSGHSGAFHWFDNWRPGCEPIPVRFNRRT
jgi:hypothetical protein